MARLVVFAIQLGLAAALALSGCLGAGDEAGADPNATADEGSPDQAPVLYQDAPLGDDPADEVLVPLGPPAPDDPSGPAVNRETPSPPPGGGGDAPRAGPRAPGNGGGGSGGGGSGGGSDPGGSTDPGEEDPPPENETTPVDDAITSLEEALPEEELPSTDPGPLTPDTGLDADAPTVGTDGSLDSEDDPVSAVVTDSGGGLENLLH